MFFYRLSTGELINLRHVVRIEPPIGNTVKVHYVTGPPPITYTVDVPDLESVLAQLKLITGGED